MPNVTAGTWWHSSTTTNPYSAVRLFQVIPAGEALCHRNIDDTLRVGAATSELADLLGGHPEMIVESLPPLFDEWLAINDDQRGQLPMSDECARDHRLARTRRSHEDAEVVEQAPPVPSPEDP